jgi:hypothetical protein
MLMGCRLGVDVGVTLGVLIPVAKEVGLGDGIAEGSGVELSLGGELNPGVTTGVLWGSCCPAAQPARKKIDKITQIEILFVLISGRFEISMMYGDDYSQFAARSYLGYR